MTVPISNYQSSLVLQHGIVTNGYYPTREGDDGFIGQIQTFAFNFAPTGTSTPDGQQLNPYAPTNITLYARIGTDYGGNATTFDLPNLNGRTMVGSTRFDHAQSYGSSTIVLTPAQEPSSLGGSSAAIDNAEPSINISYYVRVSGSYPTHSGGAGHDAASYLGEVVADSGVLRDETGYMRADGRLLNIDQYMALYSVLGTFYGGDGRTTFALPNLEGRTIIGAGQSADDGRIYALGRQVGTSQIHLTNGQVPPASHPFDNEQPSLVLNYAIAVAGIYPSQSRGPSTTDPYLGKVGTFATTFVPDGWLPADGRILNIRGNEALFSLLGTAYGGNGVTTFALPDLRGRSVIDVDSSSSIGQVVGANQQTVAHENLAPPCYCTGTLILTDRSEVPVEALSVGDHVVTASGERRAILWIGHRHTDIARHPSPERVRPVRIRAGAVAPGVPSRDLRVSPGHAVAVDGVLVKAGRLVNGASILRESIASVTYWHVELDDHDLLVADGMPAESYVECGNRHAFDNGGGVVQLHPEFEAHAAHAAQTCLPLVDGGEPLKAIRARLLAPVADRFTADPGIALVADGVALAPVSLEGRRYRFAVPEGTTSLRLVSRSGIASDILSGSGDHRRLGISIRSLTVDGAEIGDEALGEGWHDRAPGRDTRWTDGDAGLPVGRSVGFVATALERYPVTRNDSRRMQAA